MHPAAFGYVAEQVRARNLNYRGVRVADFGGRNVNGTTRKLFGRGATYVSVDICQGRQVDVVADAADVDLGAEFDVVVSTELLEHTPRGSEVVANAARHLRVGGVFIATMAGPGRAPHGAAGGNLPDGEYYRNVEPDDLRSWLGAACFSEFEVDQLGDDLRCWAVA